MSTVRCEFLVCLGGVTEDRTILIHPELLQRVSSEGKSIHVRGLKPGACLPQKSNTNSRRNPGDLGSYLLPRIHLVEDRECQISAVFRIQQIIKSTQCKSQQIHMKSPVESIGWQRRAGGGCCNGRTLDSARTQASETLESRLPLTQWFFCGIRRAGEAGGWRHLIGDGQLSWQPGRHWGRFRPVVVLGRGEQRLDDVQLPAVPGQGKRVGPYARPTQRGARYIIVSTRRIPALLAKPF